ncbi:TIGR03936 family radical SAM-associated protein [soil metagenome]
MSRQPPEQQAPPVQRLRIRYAKRGRLRFTSHRDFSRAFERAVFRAQIPMAYSSGFNPHPRISYAGAAPTGSASEAEYLEIALAEVLVPSDIHIALDESLPAGLDVLDVVDAAELGGSGLADRLVASRWVIDLQAERDETLRAVSAFAAAPSVTVERMTKKGLREFDCRAAVVSIEVTEAQPDDTGARLDLVLRHGVPSVRPDDVLTGIRSLGGFDLRGAPLLTRLAQGPLDEATGLVGDPLAR